MPERNVSTIESPIKTAATGGLAFDENGNFNTGCRAEVSDFAKPRFLTRMGQKFGALAILSGAGFGVVSQVDQETAMVQKSAYAMDIADALPGYVASSDSASFVDALNREVARIVAESSQNQADEAQTVAAKDETEITRSSQLTVDQAKEAWDLEDNQRDGAATVMVNNPGTLDWAVEDKIIKMGVAVDANTRWGKFTTAAIADQGKTSTDYALINPGVQNLKVGERMAKAYIEADVVLPESIKTNLKLNSVDTSIAGSAINLPLDLGLPPVVHNELDTTSSEGQNSLEDAALSEAQWEAKYAGSWRVANLRANDDGYIVDAVSDGGGSIQFAIKDGLGLEFKKIADNHSRTLSSLLGYPLRLDKLEAGSFKVTYSDYSGKQREIGEFKSVGELKSGTYSINSVELTGDKPKVEIALADRTDGADDRRSLPLDGKTAEEFKKIEEQQRLNSVAFKLEKETEKDRYTFVFTNAAGDEMRLPAFYLPDQDKDDEGDGWEWYRLLFAKDPIWNKLPLGYVAASLVSLSALYPIGSALYMLGMAFKRRKEARRAARLGVPAPATI